MYIILWWKDDDQFLTCVKNDNGGIKLFTRLEEADKYANEQKESDSMRVVSIEGVKA
jgi:hypothetical protein